MNNRFGPETKSIDFGEAIGTCIKKYFVFEGRASKSELWYFFLVYWVGGIILEVVAESQKSAPLALLSLALLVVGFVPMLSVGCRRLHDINKSGWWQLIPIYNFILWAQDSSSGNAQTISSQTSQTRSSQSKNYSEAPRSRLEKNDLTDELEELQELYEDGTLSEAQFKKAKNKLLK